MNVLYAVLANLAWIGLIVGAIVFITCIICKKRISMKTVLIYMFVLNLFAFFPVYHNQSGNYFLATGIVYVLQIFGMSFKFDEFREALKLAVDARWYRVLTVLLYAISPILTGAFVLSLVADIIKKLKFHLSFSNNTYIFTELNEKSRALADSYKRRNCVIVFLNVGKENETDLREHCAKEGYYILDYTANTAFRKAERRVWRIFSKLFLSSGTSGETAVFFTDSNEKSAIDKMTSFFADLKASWRAKYNKAYLISVLGEAETLVDFYKQTKEIQLRLINPAQIISYKILEEYPFYAVPNRKFEDGYNVTVVGMGDVGTHVAKDVVWCGQRMDGREPALNIVDIRPKENIRAKFEYKCPELDSKHYNINYFSANARSKVFDDLLSGELGKTECFVVSLGNDLVNAEVAREIRVKLYRAKRIWDPQIIAVIKDDEFRESVKDVCEKLKINLVGRNSEVYSKENIGESMLHYKAWLADCAYSKKEFGDFDAFRNDAAEFFKKKELDIRSNISYAIHIEYKLYDMLKKNPKEITAEEIEAEENRLFESVGEAIDKLEHYRWNAFQRSEGLVCPFSEFEMKDEGSFKEAAKRFKEETAKSAEAGIDYEKEEKTEKPQRSLFSKEHGCIVDYKWLDVLGDVMAEDELKFKRADKDINRRMFEIRKRGEMSEIRAETDRHK